MEIHEIIRVLEEQAKYHYSEAERYEKAAALINPGAVAASPQTILPKGNYETDADILNSLKTFENIHPHFWSKSELEEYLIKSEGEERATELLPLIAAFIRKSVKSNSMIRMSINNSRLYYFYSTHQDWVEHINSENLKYKVIDKYAPSKELTSKLSDEQMNPIRIVWDGINPKD